MTPELGIIEGFYGPPWSWEARAAATAFLAPHGYRFYLYAPKADGYLRRKWQEPHPREQAGRLEEFARHCASVGVRFGVGLSPYEVYLNFDDRARAALTSKLSFFADVGVRDIAILFDDMRGDTPDLAARQIDIVHWVKARVRVDRLIMCPTYYSDDPVLDRVFGARPDGYLERIGAELDKDVHVFWTGEEIVSREISAGHVRHIAQILGRKPLIWDNYPVNDTQRMSRFLHVCAFTGRSAAIAAHIAGHGINPALQPILSRIPAVTLAESYSRGVEYCYLDAFRRAAAEVLGNELGAHLYNDLLTLQDVGLERLDEKQIARLRERYASHDHDGAREILAWLDGRYRVTDEMILSW